MRRTAALACLVSLVTACGGGGGEAPPARQVAFSSLDDVTLSGDLRGRGEVGVVLAHMFPADRTSWTEFATQLAEGGYRTLAFDFRGYGGSEGTKEIPEIWKDVLAAARILTRDGAGPVVVVGASMGGTAALVAAAREPGTIDGVVTLSAPSSFMGLEAPPEVLAANMEPKLFIAAEADGTAAQTAQVFFDNSPPPKRVEIVVGSEHGTDLLDGGQADRVRRLIVDFLERLARAKSAG